MRSVRRAFAQERGQGSGPGAVPSAGQTGVRAKRQVPSCAPEHRLGGAGGLGELYVQRENPERRKSQRLCSCHL